MMGVYGMLSVGLAFFCLRYIIPEKHWSDKAARISFWSLNLGLAWMVFATLFPLGLLQLYHSISVSYYDARTLNYIGNRSNSVLEWMRMPGDIVFILGGTLTVLFLSSLGIRYMQRNSAVAHLLSWLSISLIAVKVAQNEADTDEPQNVIACKIIC
jgi:nitric oxide reductase subunit B